MPLDNEPTPTLSLEELQDAARREDWDAVDTSLSAGEIEEYEIWAVANGMEDEDPNVRDLAVSILERSSQPLKPKVCDKLVSLMGNDSNPYVQFRSAFALFSHGVRSKGVMSTLHAALADDDTAEIAQGYLDSDKPLA